MGSRLFPLSVLKTLSSTQDLGAIGEALGNLGGAITLLEKGFLSGEMGLRGEETPTPTPTPTPTARRGSLPGCSPPQGLVGLFQAALCWLFQLEGDEEEEEEEEGLLVRMAWWL